MTSDQRRTIQHLHAALEAAARRAASIQQNLESFRGAKAEVLRIRRAIRYLCPDPRQRARILALSVPVDPEKEEKCSPRRK